MEKGQKKIHCRSYNINAVACVPPQCGVFQKNGTKQVCSPGYLSWGHTANSQLRKHPNDLSWSAAGQRGRRGEMVKVVSFGGFWGVGGDVWEKGGREQHRRCLTFVRKNKSQSRGSKLYINTCQWLSQGFLLVDTNWYFPWVQALFKTLQTDL